MWWLAGLAGLVVVAIVTGVLAVAARLLPPGRFRETVSYIPNCVKLLRAIRRDTRLPTRARLVMVAALVYVLSPIQLIPNFVPVIGQTDDVLVVTCALRYACRRLPREDIEALWKGDAATLHRMLGPTQGAGPRRRSTLRRT